MVEPLSFLRLTYPLTSQLPARQNSQLAPRLRNVDKHSAVASFSRNATEQIASVVSRVWSKFGSLRLATLSKGTSDIKL